ncbi:MAG: hypothetical protein M1587_11785, partial [Thaumarchaeota archaeon]|nr:hypothetical protein [Nitrososphaerota archaeon]
FLKSQEENVLGVSKDLQSLSGVMERFALQGRIKDMSKVARITSSVAKQNYFLIGPCLKEYDALIQDEFAETAFSFLYEKKPALPSNRAIITDYISLSAVSLNPISTVVIWMANRYAKRAWLGSQVRIFADELDSLPAGEREWAKKNFEIVGPIIAETPTLSKEQIRGRLFKESRANNVIVFTIGGTSVGKHLIDFVVSDASALSRELDALIVVIAGPRVGALTQSGDREGLLVVGFTPDVMAYFKAADCVVTQSGASTLNEVSAMGVPCVTIPILNHFEQEANAKRFEQRFGFPILNYADLNHKNLVSAIKKAMTLRYAPAASQGGAKRAAELISKIL